MQATPGVRRLAPRAQDAAIVVVGILVSLAAGRVLPGRLEALSTNYLVLVPAALAAVVLVAWLSVYRRRTALVLGFALLGVVRKEPAPVDVVFALLIMATYIVDRPRPRIPAFVGLPLALFSVLTLLSMVNATDMHRAVKFEFTTLYMIALGVWLAWAFTKADWVQAAVKTYIIVAIISGLLGPVSLYLPVPGKSILVYFDSRAQGLFKDPNVYSAFLIPAAIILLEELTACRFLTWRRRTIVLAFVSVSMGIVVAYSRAAWLDFAIAIATLVCVQAVRRGGFRWAFGSISLLAVSGAAGFAVLAATGSLAFLQQRSHLESYDTQRFANQTSAFDNMTRHLFGFGPGQSEILLPISTHSSFARVAFEQGLLGIGLLVIIFAGTLLCAVLLARRRQDVNGVGTAALLAIWLGQVVNSFFIDTLHWRHVWIMAGLIWCGYALTTRRQAIEPTVPTDR